jgi:hypothetical protein
VCSLTTTRCGKSACSQSFYRQSLSCQLSVHPLVQRLPKLFCGRINRRSGIPPSRSIPMCSLNLNHLQGTLRLAQSSTSRLLRPRSQRNMINRTMSHQILPQLLSHMSRLRVLDILRAWLLLPRLIQALLLDQADYHKLDAFRKSCRAVGSPAGLHLDHSRGLSSLINLGLLLSRAPLSTPLGP